MIAYYAGGFAVLSAIFALGYFIGGEDTRDKLTRPTPDWRVVVRVEEHRCQFPNPRRERLGAGTIVQCFCGKQWEYMATWAGDSWRAHQSDTPDPSASDEKAAE